jgi:hypothetical protein
MDTKVEKKTVLTDDEFFAISRSLQNKHAIFYKFWELGAPRFTEAISTACVTFDKEGCQTGFYFNPDFWENNDQYSREFFIAHEMLHVILNHGSRAKDVFKKAKEITNIALDLVVNHTLVNKFDFNREKVNNADSFCWVDTVFEDEEVPDDKSFEFYYNKLKQLSDEFMENMPSLVDDHDGFWSEEELKEVIEDLNEFLDDSEKDEILKDVIEKHYQEDDEDKEKDKEGKKNRSATGTGGWVFLSPEKKVVKKRKWEEVIKNWASPYLKSDYREVEQWARVPRRLEMFNSYPGQGDMYLPSDMDVEDLFEDDTRIDVYFFLDTSGSCWNLKDRFFKAAESLPEDRFNVRLFCFDTSVQETTLESRKVYGGGGTRFDIMESHIQRVMNIEKIKYPHAVFVITDGYGNPVAPAYSDRWFWFLSDDGWGYGSNTRFIPKESKTFKLKDYE